MAKARGIPPLGRTPNALPAPQAPAYLPMAKARGITQDLVSFRTQDCQACGSRALCTRAAAPKPRVIKLQPRLSYEALQLARASSRSEEGLQLYSSAGGG